MTALRSIEDPTGRCCLSWPGLLAACVGLLGAGCASSPPPADFDLRAARIVPAASGPSFDVNGLPGGKAAGAAVGAGTGSGAGVVVGAVACLATGPFFPLCIAAVIPTSAALGAATGAVVGAVRTETGDAILSKAKVLSDEFVATPYQSLLAQRLHERLQVYAFDVPFEAATEPVSASAASPSATPGVSPGGSSPWIVDVAITEVGTEGKSEFALRLVTRLTLRRGASPGVWTTAKEVQSETELSAALWIADDARAMRAVLDRCIQSAASQLVGELGLTLPGQRTTDVRPRARYSTSCQDSPKQWQQAATKP
ncbi:MAG: hypothetical protein ABI460_07895 [Caldimonas sp.]